MNLYPERSYEQLAEVLERRSVEMGCLAFSMRDEPMPAEFTMDGASPVCWALVLHANAIAQLTGLASDTAPFGNELKLQPGRLPMSMCLNLMDAALEHAICLGMRHHGYKPSEWDALPDENKVIPIEPYLADLQDNWVTQTLEEGDIREQVANWPALVDRASLEAMTNELDQNADAGFNKSRIMKLSSLQ
jgi:hypothetical protein